MSSSLHFSYSPISLHDATLPRIMECVNQKCLIVILSFFSIFGLPLESSAPQRLPQPRFGQTGPINNTRLTVKTPTEVSLGFPIYPNAQFLTSYDAGNGQRYFLFGTDVNFEEMVQYYRVLLDERGNRVFDAPATHIFEIGRFEEETMAFPPGVTIKDYIWNGSEGYLHPTQGTETQRFKTIIQIVPAPSVPPDR